MIEFMVLSAPRSGSTWASNWLTVGDKICLHDPLNNYSKEELDDIEINGKTIGIACTGLYLEPNWVNEHPAKKIILHRSETEIHESIRKTGGQIPVIKRNNLHRINGLHLHYSELFTNGIKIWKYFFPEEELDRVRYNLLRNMQVNTDLRRILNFKSSAGFFDITRIPLKERLEELYF